MAQLVKNLPAMQETQIRSLGGEDPLEKEMATRSSILAWKIPWTEEPGGLQSMGSQRVDTAERLHFHFRRAYTSCVSSPSLPPTHPSSSEHTRVPGTATAAGNTAENQPESSFYGADIPVIYSGFPVIFRIGCVPFNMHSFI